ncbi:glycoside hydrolase family 2 protein [Mycetocola zhadangensis]|uniref:Glycoside hydrolase family 2 n=1 Tax=Mycetocola zhadangensis TaxID=1164595 RepID=A0A3L7ITD7_9MICO|nr:sugar-binding domain-containing protein [Mycetocola zhadangensis]RLQ81528.1 glycoside hydrolase family 2 [Mycetocola zhadangensis]RLQ82482.1 glycoside hydrolase family 2 [Mycetocola zhadangensis]GGF00927.1 beta-galactosidase [Mycetocola zhadangensis]
MSSSHARLDDEVLRASRQDGTYPRPQLLRPNWADLSGTWSFAFDDANEGLAKHWFDAPAFDREIVVPFPFESEASGIHDPSFHPVVWYSRELTADELAATGFSAGDRRLHLHFGAVDYRAQVWLNGVHLGAHEGGHTPFSFDVTDALDSSSATQLLVVRAEDDPLDVSQPRGKQDWRLEPHSIWYHRTSGIWQPVWLESTADTFVTLLHTTPNVPEGTVTLRVDLNRRPTTDVRLKMAVSCEGDELATVSVAARDIGTTVVVHLPLQSNGQAYEELLWSPEHPRLLDVSVTVLEDAASAQVADEVYSYFGMRSATVAGGHFLLNDRPYYVRSVLNQGYWPESHLAAPSAAALKREAELIKELGFNATRVHQKFEDPRFLFWADVLGLLVWAETPGTFEFSPRAITRMSAEWTAVIERDLSHPSIVTWVPLNESWGVQHIAHDSRMRAYAQSLVSLTRALDPSRPVVSNDGWEHVDSDILSIHDYEWSGEVLGDRYRDKDACEALLGGIGPAGRRMLLAGQEIGERPVMVTEFGGISYASKQVPDDAWGYSTATSSDDFVDRLDAVLGALAESSALAGFCYTQLVDTLQETNGLLADDRTPKADMATLRRVITRSGPAA